jgi:hypothetical protein
LADPLYSVRQIVALYHVEHDIWTDHTIKFLRRCTKAESDTGGSHNKTLHRARLDAELVELIIDMLCKAVEHKLGYEGNVLPIGGIGTEWDKEVSKTFQYERTHQKIAYAKEHAIMHHLDQYRKVMDTELKNLLGSEVYADCEKLLDTENIRDGIVP